MTQNTTNIAGGERNDIFTVFGSIPEEGSGIGTRAPSIIASYVLCSMYYSTVCRRSYSRDALKTPHPLCDVAPPSVSHVLRVGGNDSKLYQNSSSFSLYTMAVGYVISIIAWVLILL